MYLYEFEIQNFIDFWFWEGAAQIFDFPGFGTDI